MEKDLLIDGKKIRNRLFLGTGKFSSLEVMQETILKSEVEVVTVAMRRMDLTKSSLPDQKNIMEFIPRNIILMPNTSGARNSDEAIRIARLCRALTKSNWIKIEVIPDPHYLLPDPLETLKAAETLVREGFQVFPYINADPVLAKKLEEVGVAAVMPLGSPIGTNRGLETKEMIKIIIDIVKIPVIVDAGIGRPSDATLAMELGASAVLVNTAVASSLDPVSMGVAFSLATRVGLMAFQAGVPQKNYKARASSPLTGFLHN